MKSIIKFPVNITAGHLYQSHKGSNALDLNNATVIYAPFRCKVVKIYGASSTNSVWFESIEKVGTPMGLFHVTFRCAHMDTLKFNSLGVVLGKVFEQFEICYYAGIGGTKAKHVHIEFGLGKIKGSGWLNTGYTAFNLPVKKIDTEFGSRLMHECVFLQEGVKVSTCDDYQKKYDWQWEEEVEDMSEIVTRFNLNDPEWDYRFSLDGNKFGEAYDKTTMDYFSDKKLEAESWELFAAVNASVFYSYEGATYAEGLEKSRGINNQDLSMTCVSKFKDTMAVALTTDGKIIFDKQNEIAKDLDKYYGAFTGMFGIMKGGQLCEWGKEIESQRNNMYSNISGRTVIAYDAINNHLILVSIKGDTGRSGAYGKDLYSVLRKHGATDGVCMDGGGSVFLINEGKSIVSSTRAVKNAFLVYRRKKKIVEDPRDKKIMDLEKELLDLKLSNKELCVKIEKAKEALE